jgi:hypothetical protein
MVGSTLTQFQSFMKDNYVKGEVVRLINEDHLFLDKLGSDESGTGLQLIVPLIETNAQGVGATLPVAQATAEAAAGANLGGFQWNIPWGDYNGAINIGDKVMKLSASDMGAFFRNKKEEIDSLYRTFADTMESYLLRDSGHSIGSGTISSGVVTLATLTDIVHFELGMPIVASAAAGLSTSDALIDPSIGYVILVNYNTGGLTLSATPTGSAGTPANWTGTMFFFRSGDFGGGASPNFILHGFGAWCPALSPTETSFCGVDRRINPMRRSGVRLLAADVSTLSLEDRIKKLLIKGFTFGRPFKEVWIHPYQWLALANTMDARGQRPLDGKTATGSYSKLQMASPGGMVDILSNKFMPTDTAYAMDMKQLKLISAGGFPFVVNEDGQSMLRRVNANVYEHRISTYPAFYPKNTLAMGRTPLAAVA